MRISPCHKIAQAGFTTQAFEHYNRYAPQVADALTEMFVSDTSTHKVGNGAETLIGVAPSASAQTLTEQFEAWRERSLLNHYRILYPRLVSIFGFGMEPKPTRPSS